MMTRDDFAGLSQTTFAVQAEDGRRADLVLEEVSELKQVQNSEHYSLLFRGPHEVPLAQGLHQFSRDGAEQMEIFIVPVGCDANGYLYESVFNYLRAAENSSGNACGN